MKVIDKTYQIISKYKLNIIFDTENLIILTPKNIPNVYFYIYPYNNILKIKTEQDKYDKLPEIEDQKTTYNISSNVKFDEVLSIINKFYEN